MRNLKKFLALALATTMVLGSTTIALAEEMNTEGAGTGTGVMEGTVATDVFQVVVPTDAGEAFNFTLDPEGLIAKTNEAKYGGEDKYQDDASVFFGNANEEGTVVAYTSTSDAVTITNKGTQLAKVSIDVEIDGVDGITMADTDEFTDDTVSLYLAMVDADGTKTAITETKEDAVTAVIEAAPEGAYDFAYDEDDGYVYELVDDLTGITFADYSFQLTGACNTAADWSELAEAAPSVTVTWSVEVYEAQGTAATFAAGTGVGTITYTDGTDDMKIDKIISIEMTNADGLTFDGFNAFEGAWEAATDNNADTITLDASYVKWYKELGTCDATVTYKTTLGQIITVVVEDVVVAETE